MAKQTPSGTIAAQPNAIARLRQFFQDVMVEMNKVAWPAQDELKGLTVVVLIALLILAGIIGVYDWVFLHVIKLLLLLG